jgi:hypothetical protein
MAFTLGRRPWWRAPVDWLPFVVFFLAYDYTRGAASLLGFPTHWELPARIDRAIGFGNIPSVWLQERLAGAADQVPWWEVAVSTVYMSFFIVPFVLAGVLWMQSRDQFVRFMVRLALVSGIALIGYVVVPAAPPWAAARCTHAEVANHPSDPPCMADDRLVHRAGAVLPGLAGPEPDEPEIVARISSRGFLSIPGMHLTEGFVKTGIDASNRVAAVPSLHAGEAALVCAFGWSFVRRRWRPLLAAYPLLMGFALVFGGDHYIFDVLLGWGVVAVVMTGLGMLERRRARQEEYVPASLGA